MARLSLYLATLLLGTNFSASTVPGPRPALRATVQAVGAEQEFVDLANAERQAKGLGVLTIDPLLVKVAREHSREMWEKDYFDHISPTVGSRTPMKRYLGALGHTPTWAYLGENLFYCSVVDVSRGHTCLMDSLPHRENILNEKFERIGVGVFTSPDGQFWVTEMFLAQVD